MAWTSESLPVMCQTACRQTNSVLHVRHDVITSESPIWKTALLQYVIRVSESNTVLAVCVHKGTVGVPPPFQGCKSGRSRGVNLECASIPPLCRVAPCQGCEARMSRGADKQGLLMLLSQKKQSL
jgi:hypothetical protein